jgi:hypothetical protein
VRSFFVACDLVTAALVLGGVFMGLPARWWPVDGLASLVAALFIASALTLLFRPAAARRVLVPACAVILVLGLVMITLVAITATHLAAVHGAVGSGGASLFALAAVLLAPYVVALPAAQLVWITKAAR